MTNTKRLLAVLLVLFMLVQYLPGIVIVSAADPLQYNYSDSSNSGKRDEVATTLNGTGAADYYGTAYQYDTLSQQNSSSLLSSLRTLMSSTHTKNSSYDNCKNMADQTDCENNNGKVTLFYTSVSTTSSDWNREHVWPKSLGGYENSGPGADMHHIRPTDNQVNTDRDNSKFAELGDSANKSIGKNAANGELGGYYNSTYFEPLDNVKGDVARICLYMYVRYGASHSKCSSITNVFQSVDVLLAWMEADPVDTWELGRNEVVEAYQGNRNVFIDYPEYAWLLFGKSVPTNMSTPSQGGTGTTTPSNPGTSGGSTTPSTPTNPTTDKEILDAAYALSAGQYLDGTYTLTGKITKLDSYKNPTIVVGNYTSQPMYCYRLVDDRFVVGATITVTGRIMNYDGLIEMKDCTLVNISLPGSDDTGSSTPSTPSTPGDSFTGSGSIDFSQASQRESWDGNQQTWKNDSITVLNEKSQSTNAVANYTGPARFYAGSKITITASGMTEITFVCNSTGYAATLKDSINATNCTVSASGNTVIVTFATPVNSFVIEKLSAQVRLNSLEVAGKAVTPDDDVTDNPSTETTPPETEPPETVPPVEDIPSNKGGFLEIVELIVDGTYKGAYLHEAISQAVVIYNTLPDGDKAAVSDAYHQLKAAIDTYNADANKLNEDAVSARENILPGAIIGFSLIAFAGYSLLGKKFF